MAWRSVCVLALVLAFGCCASFAEQDYGYLPADLESDLSLRNLYENWIVKHGHSFSEEEKETRFVTFKANVLKIDSYNQKDLSYKLAVNQFAHLTREEFKERYLGYRKRGSVRLPSLKKSRSLNVTLKTTDLPDSIDWRELGAVTEVKDQSVCGSCWAFSAIGSIEGVNAIYTGELVSLSEQELVDCDTFDEGCNGGLMDYAFEFVIENGGIDTETDYPYTGVDGVCDNTKLNSRVVSIDSYVDVTPNSESALQAAVATQPVSVAVEADEFAFEYYSSGILTGSCGTDLDHGVLVVGYGTSSDGVDYWIVKNSWGTSWGDNGYIYLERNIDSPFGMCGIAIEPSYPVKTSANPSPAPSSDYPPPPPTLSPPSPDVEPVECDKNSYCPAETTCCCVFNIGFWCLSWGCCSYPNAICCSDHVHCCPSEYPVCNIFDGYCSQSDSSDSRVIKSVPALKQLPAQKYPYSTWPLRQSTSLSKLEIDADQFSKQIEQEEGN